MTLSHFQVLSKSVADALELVKPNHPEVRETERFVRLMNRFFDMFNVRSQTEGVKKRNSDLLPYRSLSDPRFEASNSLMNNACASYYNSSLVMDFYN